MPIPAIYSPFNAQIQTAWGMDKGAQVSTSSQLFCTALGSLVSMGLYPSGLTMIPLVPAGITAASSLMTAGLSMGKGATVSTTSRQMAQAVSLIAPLCPPVGLATLGTMMETAMSMGKGAKVSTVAQQIAQATVVYYQAGGTV